MCVKLICNEPINYLKMLLHKIVLILVGCSNNTLQLLLSALLYIIFLFFFSENRPNIKLLAVDDQYDNVRIFLCDIPGC